MPDSSLEDFCVKEGFNPSLEKLTVRIGLVAGNKCKSPRLSSIGFGFTGNYTCGNFKGDGVSEMKGASSFGYILLQ